MRTLSSVTLSLGLLVALGACGQNTVSDACLNQWNLCIEDSEAAGMFDQQAFMNDCAAAADGANESGTVASQEEIDCVADASSCSELEACVD